MSIPITTRRVDQILSNTILNYSGITSEIPVVFDFPKKNMYHFLKKGSKFLLTSGTVCCTESKYSKVQLSTFSLAL